MKFKSNNYLKAMIISMLITGIILSSHTALAATYIKGQSLVASNQENASKGLSFPGLDITWLDLGNDHVTSFSPMPNQFSEGIFTLNMLSQTISFDTSGKIISAGDYNGVQKFSDGMALVNKYLPPSETYKPGMLMAPPGKVVGYIDKEGNEVIPLGKLSGLNSCFCEGFAVIGDGYDQKKGYINKKGEIVIPQIYSDAGDFSEGLAPVKSEETKLWGYIDKTGKMIIPMEYEDAKSFSENVAYVVKNGLAGYIDTSGKTVIDFKFKTDENNFTDKNFYNDLAVAIDDSGKYGYIDKTGNFVIAAKYKEADPFIGDVAFVLSENQAYTNGYGSSFLINNVGERITPLWYYGRYSEECMKEGLIRALSPSNDKSIVMLNKYGAEIIPSSLKISNISPFNEGYALLMAFNKEGEMAIGLVKRPQNIEEIKNGKLIKVLVDDNQLDFTDTDPIIEKSRVLVPMREIFECLGAELSWDKENNTVSGTKGSTTVTLKIGDTVGYINGKPVNLDVPAKIKNSRTIVPVRFIAESLNADVTWDDESKTVKINIK